jgi:hypothetical protein
VFFFPQVIIRILLFFLKGSYHNKGKKKGLIIQNPLKTVLFGEGVDTFMSTGYSIKSSLK